jgi:hypothetical protein
MLTKASVLALLALGAPVLLATLPAHAGDAPASGTDTTKQAGGDGKDAGKPDAAKTDPNAPDPLDPFEETGKSYLFIGVRYRDAIIPTFMIHWFADGGTTVNVPMVGPEFTKRRDNFEVDIAVMYADYGMNPALFKGHGHPLQDYELVGSTLKQIYVMADLLYEIPIEKKSDKTGDKVGRFSFLVGAGVGMGFVFGSLYRSQAYPNMPNADPGNPSQWSACHSPNDGQTAAGAGYCNNSMNNHYWPSWSPSSRNSVGAGAYAEPSWANGGSKPNIFPWIALPQIAFRYKPIKQLQTKLGFGFSTSGFFFDLSASYGL